MRKRVHDFMIDFNKIQTYKENNRIEAKRATGGFPGSLWETYSAFANTYGGIILLGVEELPDKSLKTVALPEPERLIEIFWRYVEDRQKISANILCSEDVQIAEAGGNRIVAIEVPRAERRDKPVFLGTDPYTGSYRRNGEGDYRCTRAEVDGMLRDRMNVSRDSEILSHMAMDSFDRESISRFKNRVRTASGVPETDAEFLRSAGAAAAGRDRHLHPTTGGLLMLGRRECIRSEFPKLFWEYSEKAGEDIPPYHYFGKNLFDFYDTVTKRLVEQKSAIHPRISFDKDMLCAVFEGLANALMHADYFESRGILIEITPEAIQITNPGGMRIAREKAFRGGISDPRNTILIQLFHLLQVGNRNGSGLRKIRSIWQHSGLSEPILTERFGPDQTVLSLPFAACKNISAGEEKKREEYERQKQLVMEYLTFYVSGTAEMLAKSLKISIAAAEKVLSSMENDGILSKTIFENGNTVYRLAS